ncbi:MAG TPA: PIN domain-containing protein [Stellaceae bacterium]|nr:PIN domain-containing protein [Stellaceae bacterium]
MTIEVTADSNIYISALVFAGRPLQLLEAARGGAVQLAISRPLLDEIHRILRDKFGWPERNLAGTAEELATFTSLVWPTRRIDAVPEDPDGNRVLECAVAGISSLATGRFFDSAASKAYTLCV